MPHSAARGATRKRAGPRNASSRSARKGHVWDPRNQRPELWNLFNTRDPPGETIRVFPLSNWTELDIWHYIMLEKIPVVPLYFAKKRPVVRRGGTWIMVDDDGLPLEAGEKPEMRLRALPHARLLSVDRRDRVRCATRWKTSSPRCRRHASRNAKAA